METIGRNDACWCGSGKKYKKCHCQFDEKLKELQQEGHIIPSHDMIKTPEQIEKIKESGKINIAVLDYVAEHICAGISTEQILKRELQHSRLMTGYMNRQHPAVQSLLH